MDHCWHTVFTPEPKMRCCFCGKYTKMPNCTGQKVSWSGHGKYAPEVLLAFPPAEECPKR